MSHIWAALVTDLGLEPDLHRVGAPRPRQTFAGRVGHARAAVTFDAMTAAVRVTVARNADHVLAGADDYRILPRAGLGGWPGGPRTGEPDFDAAVALMVADDEAEALLLRLDAPTRALIAELVEFGAWICGEQVLFEPRATAAIQSVEDARHLVHTAADLVRALVPPGPEALIAMAFGDPVPQQRARALDRVGRMAATGGRWADPILEAIGTHRPPEGPTLLRAIAAHCQSRFDAWLAALDHYPADAADALLAALPVARRAAAEDAVVARLARALLDPARRPPSAGALARHPDVVRALVPYCRESPAGRRFLAGIDVPDEALRITLAGLGAADDPAAAIAALSRVRPRTPAGERALIAALDGLADRAPAAVDRALLGFAPTSPPGRRALIDALSSRRGPAIDQALVGRVRDDPDAGPRQLEEAARRVAAALDEVRDPPLMALCHAPLPPAFEAALIEALCASRPRFGAAWLAGFAPHLRQTEPQAEARILRVLGELADPAGEDRCLAALDGGDFLRVAAADALAALGTARALGPLDAISGFFANADVKAAARRAMEAIRERETRGPRGGLSVSGGRGGGVSVVE